MIIFSRIEVMSTFQKNLHPVTNYRNLLRTMYLLYHEAPSNYQINL